VPLVRLREVVRHGGFSAVPGIDLCHLYIEGDVDHQALAARWDERLVRRSLAEPLAFGDTLEGLTHAYATTHPFLHRRVLDDLVADDDGPAARERLSAQQQNAFFYRNAYGLYHQLARYRGWVSFPLMLGNYAALFVGIGRHSRLLTMNVDESVSAVVAFAGISKAYGRAVLRAHGIPVAPGDVVASADEAVELAHALGGEMALKTLRGGNSEGVILGVAGEACREAAARLLAHESEILVEKMVAGRELRLHFLGGRLHEVRVAQAPVVEGDGVTPLAALMRARLPVYAEMALSTDYQRRRLVYQLWRWGVREAAGVEWVVLPAGARARVAAATGHGIENRPLEALAPADRARLEGFLQRYGASSAGIDVIVDEAGHLLAVLEINAPSGFAYREEPHRAADRELLALVSRDPGFLDEDGKVPVWLGAAVERDDAVSAAFGERFPGGVEATLDPTAGWLPVLTRRCDAFLLWVDERVVARHGMPANLDALLIGAGGRDALAESAPLLVRVAEAAGARFAALEDVDDA
jgi:hypothetical protein